MREAGKGSAPRPYSVSNEEYAARWDAIFGRDEVVGVKEFLEKATATSQPLDKEDKDTHNDRKDTKHIPRDVELDKK